MAEKKPSPSCALSITSDKDIHGIFEKIDKATSVALICHDTPDPDTIAPAYAISEYCTTKGISSRIFYGGSISHFQNKALVNVLNIEMIKLDNLLDEINSEEVEPKEFISNYLKENFDLIIFFDTSSIRGTGNVKMITNIPDIIIDHHSSDIDLNGDSSKVILLHHRCGATSSIISYMFERKGVEISKEAGTALFIGLMSDTNFMSSSNVDEIDQAANKYLLQNVDFAMYTRIMDYDMPDELIKVRKIAYGDYFYRENNLAIVGVGYLKPEFKDLGAVIADEIDRIEGIQKIVVIGIIEERGGTKAITANVRTSADTLNTNLFSKNIFGDKMAGGKQGSAGAYLKLSDLASSLSETDRDNFFKMTFEHYKKVILEVHTNA